MSTLLSPTDIPSPADIGLPSHLTAYRPAQWEAIEHALYSPERFQVLCLPTGIGKTLVGQSIQVITQDRAVTVTASKGLQQQYLSEFGDPSLHSNAVLLRKLAAKLLGSKKLVGSTQASKFLVDMRGKDNYDCSERPRVSCADGARVGCTLCPSTFCTYHNALSTFMKSPNGLTNYAYWLHMNKQVRGLEPKLGKGNPIKILILDEAHTAPTELANFLAISISERECKQVLKTVPPQSEDIKEWLDWAKTWGAYAVTEAKERGLKLVHAPIQDVHRDLPDIRKLDGLGRRINSLRDNIKDATGWTCEEKTNRNGGRYWDFDPVWPGLYAEKSLFVGIPKVILLSATIRPKTTGLLGIKNGDSQFREWPRQFPVHRSPIYHIPAVRMNWRTTDAELLEWVRVIDEILDSRLVQAERKGIIHTVSYTRQEFLWVHSRHRALFIGNDQDPNTPSAAQIVEQFKKRKDACVLVSPSFSTGWDFPGKQCEWQIIAKVPYPPSKSKVMKERMKRDPHYLDYLTMQELVQACGRGTRFEQDRCETFVVDDMIKGFAWRARAQAPGWFTIRPMGVGKLPPLPPALP